MHHEYYYYDKAQLLSAPQIPMEVMADKPTVFKAIAREMADFIKEKNEKGEIIRSERSYGSCSRSFYVGDNVKASDIKAKFDGGVLEVIVPKKEAKELENKEVIMIE